MFRYNVRGENIEVTEAIRDYVEKKVGKLERYFSDAPDATAHVNLKKLIQKNSKSGSNDPITQSCTAYVPKKLLQDFIRKVSIWVVDKLERQIRKFKTKFLIVNPVNGHEYCRCCCFIQ